MSFFRKSLLASVGHVVVQLVNVLGTMLLARALRADMGQYDLFRNVATLAVTVTSLGVGSANIYVLNGRDAPVAQLASNTLKLLLVLGTALAGGMAAAILGLGWYFGQVSPAVAIAFGCAAAAMLGVILLRSFLIARIAVRQMIVVDLVAPALVLGGAAILGVAGRLDAPAALVLHSAGNVLSLLVLLGYLRPHLALRTRFDRALMRVVLRCGLQNFAANVLGVLLAALTVMLLRYLSLDEGVFGPVALYTRATALCGLAMMVPAALGPLLYARWSGALGPERRQQVELAGRLNVAYGCAMALVLVVGGKYLLWGIYGAAFVPAQAALYVLAPAYALKALFDVYINLFASDGRAGLTASILGAATVVAVIGTLTLVPAHGFVGAAAAVLLAELFCIGAAAALGRRLYGVSLARCVLIRWSDVRLVAGQLLARRPTPPLQPEGSQSAP